MTIEEFKKAIHKSNWFDNFYFYLAAIAFIGLGVFFIYDTSINQLKYKSRDTYIFVYGIALFMILFGSYAMYATFKRYKVLAFESDLSTIEKKRVIAEIIKEFNYPFYENTRQYWQFIYFGKWWASDYNIYLTFDETKIYACVLARTSGGSGFIDFGGTEKFRKKLSIVINEVLLKN
jgi:hypothetical protein